MKEYGFLIILVLGIIIGIIMTRFIIWLNFKAPVRGLFAGDETVTPNGASDIMPYVGRKRALGCALFPMY